MTLPDWLLQGGLSAALGAVGWLVARRLTGAGHKEETERLLSAIDLVERLQRAGLSLEEARKVAQDVQAGAKTLSFQTGQEVAKSEAGPDHDLPGHFSSTYALKVRLSARLDTLDAEMAEVISTTMLLQSDAEQSAAREVQASWDKFRTAEAELAMIGAEGGTGEAIYGMSAMIAVTEQRIAMLKAQLEERKELSRI